MNLFVVFILAFILWLTSGIYLRPIVERLSTRTNEIVAYWTVVSIFDVFLTIFATLLCPDVYFTRWDFPIKDSLILFAFAILSFLPAAGEVQRFLRPESKEDRKAVELVRNASFAQLAVLQIISAALPEELVFRYVFLGLLSLWNPFVALIAVSTFFGLSHKFSHPDRSWAVLTSNTLMGFVLGLGYLYTRSLLVVIAVHWLGDMVPVLYIKYGEARRAILGGVFLSLLPPVVFWDQTEKIIGYLDGMFSISGFFLGLAVGLALLFVVYMEV